MIPALTRFVQFLEAIVRGFGALAAWVCVALVLLVAGDVFARYLFRTGAVWAQELQWHLISPIALFGMSYALLSGEQVRVDVLYERFSPLVQRIIEIIGGLLMILLGVLLVKLSLPWVEMSYARGEGSPNPGGLPYRFALKALIPLGFGLLAVQGLAHVLRHAFALPPRKPA
ncbi:TRAP-type mannitol/chloroaromatic compound transport system permease small subunit [Roseinatronobacter thiooxidans]|uniref:TRAP transporter small permease protein n=1 Tax=Roseinatronobacter thiooxidans TaxID=121821 RepID=A0A2W7PX51_9RHOB|nr:TRAP transporter small permease subunit [Roseinatronobacter thiooxidans]PZX40738.1 TRAP-type mannitol/chloroaromatic compound transport system permease small subunit [Roseinatronobacter thiooxidans]